jgi:hypothetical protein
MSDDTGRQSATIYHFPARPRERSEAQRKERERDAQIPAVATGSAWNHAAALEEPQAS